MTSGGYPSLPRLGDLSVALVYAELHRLSVRAASRPAPLFGDEVRFAGALRGERDVVERVRVSA